MKSIDRLCGRIRSAQLRSRGIRVGRHCRISFKAAFSTQPGNGTIEIGNSTSIFPYARLEAYGGAIRIGDHCSVNPFCILYGHGGLTIGSCVRIAAHVVIVPANHSFDDVATPICAQPLTRLGIVIEDDVWIGAGARILDGVRLGRGCVIGAGAVVTKDTRPNGIYGGVPARLIGERGRVVAVA
jgi:acetyltransferase-like isoleucine patch superfamily enzyme